MLAAEELTVPPVWVKVALPPLSSPIIIPFVVRLPDPLTVTVPMRPAWLVITKPRGPPWVEVKLPVMFSTAGWPEFEPTQN